MAEKRRRKAPLAEAFDALKDMVDSSGDLAASTVELFIQKLRETVDLLDAGRAPQAAEALRAAREVSFALWEDVGSRHPLGRMPMWELLRTWNGHLAISSFRRTNTFAGFLRDLESWNKALTEAGALMELGRGEEARRLLVSNLYPDYSRPSVTLRPPREDRPEAWEKWRRVARDFDLGIGVNEWSTKFSPSRLWVVLYVLYEEQAPIGSYARRMALTLFEIHPKGWSPIRHEVSPDYGSFSVNDRGEVLTSIGDEAGFAWWLTRPDWSRSLGRLCGHGHDVKSDATGAFDLDGWTRLRATPDGKNVSWGFRGFRRDMEFRKSSFNEPYFHVPAGMDRETAALFSNHLESIRDEALQGLQGTPDHKVLAYWRDYASEALSLISDLRDTLGFGAPILLPRVYQRRESYYA